jgi:ArsR family transcriptional regulator
MPTLVPDLVPDLSDGQALMVLRALADPIRLRVVEALAGGERCVCELTAELDLAQSRLSFHLRVLRQAGLIGARQQGRWMYYRLEPGALPGLRGWLACWPVPRSPRTPQATGC